jgi:hypothetical protein
MLKKDSELYPVMRDFLEGKTTFPEVSEITLNYARRMYPDPLHSNHEGVGVILEEFDELREAIGKKLGSENILAELASVSAMCHRLAEDCLLNLQEDQVVGMLCQK